MVKHMMLTGLLCLCAGMLRAQEAVLQQIAENNTELKALRQQHAAQQEARQAQQSATGPTVGAYYLPWGEHSTGDYWEVEASQTFAFPTVYGAQRSTRSAQASAEAQAYTQRRQEILLSAQESCLRLVYCQKQQALATGRLAQARKVLEHTQGRYAAQEVNKLAVHKARLALLEAEMQAEDWAHGQREELATLRGLNGGQAIAWEATDYTQPLDSLNQAALWEQRLAQDPALLAARGALRVAELQMNLTKQRALPNVTVGANYQGVPNSGYGGLFAGVSIPLWRNQAAQSSARGRVAAQQLHITALEEQTRAQFEAQWGHYHHKLAQYQAYRATLSELDSEIFLYQAYTLGQLAYTEYFLELSYYQRAQNTLLHLEQELHVLRARLLSFTL